MIKSEARTAKTNDFHRFMLMQKAIAELMYSIEDATVVKTNIKPIPPIACKEMRVG